MLDLLKFSITARNDGARRAVNDLKGDLRGIRGAMAGVNEQAKRVGKNMRNLGAGLTAGVTAPIALLGRESVKLYQIQAEAEGAVGQAIVSTGGAAGKTLEELKGIASELQGLTTFGDEDILRNVTAPLLTFTKIQGDVFDRAQANVLDMATLLKMDLKNASVLVGKALNDPIKGIAALGRSGVQFSDDQKAMIKSLVETGDAAAAQTLILEELETQFKGQAGMVADLPLGQWAQVSNAIGDVKEQLGEQIVPFIKPLVEQVKVAVQWFGNLSPEVKNNIVVFGGLAAVVGPLIGGVGLLAIAFGALASPIGAVLIGIAAVGAASIYVAKRWDEWADRFPILKKIAGIGASLKTAWGNLTALKWDELVTKIDWAARAGPLDWADLALKIEWGELLPKIEWRDWITKINWAPRAGALLWSEVVSKIEWGDFVTQVNWATWVTKINWAPSAGKLVWDRLVSKIEWGNWVTKVNWDVFVSVINWRRWVPTINWATFVPTIKWTDWVPAFNWADWVPTINWSDFIPEIDWGGIFSGRTPAPEKIKGEMEKVGVSMSDGLMQGITKSETQNKSDIADYLGGLEDAARDAVDSHSPSRDWMRLGHDLMDGLGLGIASKAGETIDIVRDVADSLGGTASRTMGVMGSLRDGAKSIFRDVLSGASSFRGAFSSVLGGWGQSLLNSGIDSLFGAIWPSAQGNVVSNRSIVPFAKGGVFDSPMMFPMRGGTGLMAEAGPEAIMPLSRASDGTLGVRAQGGGGGGVARIELVLRGQGVTVEQSRQIAGDVAFAVVDAGLRQYDGGFSGRVEAYNEHGTY